MGGRPGTSRTSSPAAARAGPTWITASSRAFLRLRPSNRLIFSGLAASGSSSGSTNTLASAELFALPIVEMISAKAR